jgi:DNA-binding NtrC family response regulator
MHTVLVLDDSHEFRHYARETLQLAGFEVILALDGDHALRKLGQQTFGAVVMDTAPPGGEGLGVLRRVRSLAPDLPVIAITGHPSPETEEACATLGVCAYLPKPVAPAVLLSAVEAATGGQVGARSGPAEAGWTGLQQGALATADGKVV